MTDDTHPSYRIYSFLGRRVLAMPAASRRLRLAGLARYQPFTLKRKIFRRLIWASINTGLDWCFSRPAVSPLAGVIDFDFYLWMRQAQDDLGAGELSGVVYWPPQTSRRRIYVHLFDSDLTPVGFVKVSFDTENDDSLERETKALEKLHADKLKESRVPRVLSAGRFGGHVYLITEPIPVSAKPVPSRIETFPRACICEYAGPPRHVSLQEVTGLSWWASYRNTLENTDGGFHEDLMRCMDQGIDIGNAHGDMGSANLLRDGNTLWVYDWESYCDDAPALADEIGYYMGLNFTRILTDPRQELGRFRQRFLRDASNQRQCSVLVSLAFLASLGRDDAILFLKNWGNSEPISP